MGGKKKKKHFVDTSVRVNTVTKETKEENNSKNDGPSKSSKLVIEIPPGYIKLFKRNPDYTIIINEANSKHFIPLKHKSLMDIFKMQSKEPETLANYIYDVTDIFIDATFRIVGRNYDQVAELLAKLEGVSKQNDVKFYLTLSEYKENLPIEMFKYAEVI